MSFTADRYGHLYPSLSTALTAQLEDVFTTAAGADIDLDRPSSLVIDQSVVAAGPSRAVSRSYLALATP